MGADGGDRTAMPIWAKAIAIGAACSATTLLVSALWATVIDNEFGPGLLMAQAAFAITLLAALIVLAERRWRTRTRPEDRSELDAALKKMRKSVKARNRRAATKTPIDDEVPF